MKFCQLIKSGQMDEQNQGILGMLDQDFQENDFLNNFLTFNHGNQGSKEKEEEKHLHKSEKERKKGRPKGNKNMQNTKNRKAKDELSNNVEKNKGHWLLEQNKRYHWFLQIHSNHFIHKELRRMDKIFKSMANFIGTRQAEQCRSHHQKMQKKYHSFCKIIQNLRLSFYSSYDREKVKQDLEHNGFIDYDPLISDLQIDKEHLVGVEGYEHKKDSEEYLDEKALIDDLNVKKNKSLFEDDYENELNKFNHPQK